MPEQITVTTGARLHFGPLAVGAETGRRFGGLGMMIDAPRLVVTGRRTARDEATGPKDAVERTLRLLADERGAAVQPVSGGVHIDVLEAIPSHGGFGSGTQLGLTVALIQSLLADGQRPSVETLAARSGRGRRSAIGIYGFEHGGLIVDAGKPSPDSLGGLACRVPLPPTWRVLLATPRDRPGLHGASESLLFEQLPPMPQATTERLCRLVLTGILPAAQSADFDEFALSLGEYGTLVGEYFAPAQGGVYAHPAMADLAATLHARGVQGIGQTSWGPTLCMWCASLDEAEHLRRTMSRLPAADGVDFRIAAPRNTGATVCRTPE